MEENILKQAGLSEEQAEIYETLLEKGPQKASPLSSWTGIKRGLVYKILEQLENMGLVEKKGGTGTVSVFYPSHPALLLDKMERDKKNLELAKEVVTLGIGNLSSKYNLIAGKPNVRFFEGEEGAKAVTNDMPTQNKEILAYIDSKKVLDLLPDLNNEHIKIRTRLNIKKKIMIPDTPFHTERAKKYNKDITEARIMKDISSFPSALQIYDDKISFLTLTDKKTVGIILEDKDIAEMMRNVFMLNWENSEEA